VRVVGWQTLVRNESEGVLVGAEVGTSPVSPGGGALSTDRSFTEDLSMSISVGTRKMVIYA
jgi:hypothetical protein